MNFREYADLIKKVDPEQRPKTGKIPLGAASGGGGGFSRGSAWGAKSSPTITESGGVRTINYNQNASTSSGPAKTVHSPRVEGPKVEGGGGKPITSIDKDEMKTTEPKKCWHRTKLEKIKKQALEKDGEMGLDAAQTQSSVDKAFNKPVTEAPKEQPKAATGNWVQRTFGSVVERGAAKQAAGEYNRKNEYFRMKLEELKKND